MSQGDPDVERSLDGSLGSNGRREAAMLAGRARGSQADARLRGTLAGDRGVGLAVVGHETARCRVSL